jgi:hypothetical protein
MDIFKEEEDLAGVIYSQIRSMGRRYRISVPVAPIQMYEFVGGGDFTTLKVVAGVIHNRIRNIVGRHRIPVPARDRCLNPE